MIKRCTQCKKLKPKTLELFHKSKYGKEGLNPKCKKCVCFNRRNWKWLKRRKRTPKNPLGLPESKTCSTCSKEKGSSEFRITESRRQGISLYYQCKECERTYDRSRPLIKTVKELKIAEELKIAMEAKRVEMEAKHVGLILERERKKVIAKEKKKVVNLKYQKKKRKTDPLWRLAANLRHRTNMALRNGNFTKRSGLSQYLGCTMQEFVAHLESLWQPGMTWDNYGAEQYHWNMDHVIPLASADTVEEMHSLCHFSNVRPMWFRLNCKKNDKSPEEWTAYKLLHNIDESKMPISPDPLKTEPTPAMVATLPGTN